MKGAEQNGNALRLKFLQLDSNGIDILHQEGVIRVPSVG
jgi:hypothetical protein